MKVEEREVQQETRLVRYSKGLDISIYLWIAD